MKTKTSKHIKQTNAGTFQVAIPFMTTAATRKDAKLILNILRMYKKVALNEATNLKAGIRSGDGRSLREVWRDDKIVRLTKKRASKTYK